ncbi:MAG: phosphoribosylglycinamide formyltransferase [Mycoplasmoidaceae bacterium]
MIKIAIFGSGNGSNFNAIAQAIFEKKIKDSQIMFAHTNKEDCYMNKRVLSFNIPLYSFSNTNLSNHEYEERLISIIEKYDIDIICLAGYLKILSSDFLNKIPEKTLIINIHPSLLPKYPGLNSIQRAFDNGDEYLGVTTHFVTSIVDSGVIIFQSRVKKLLTLVDTEKKIHEVEHKLYVDSINYVIKNNIKKG